MSRPASLSASLAASAALHGLALAVLLEIVGPPVLQPARVIPVSLIALPGGGGGGEPSAAAPAGAPPLPQPVAKAVRPHPAARPRPVMAAVPPEAAPGSSSARETAVGGGNGIGGDGTGVGPGEAGGDGSGGARVAYGSNPLPPYPLVARRLGKEGVVLLDVLVAPDGHAAEVRVVRSCGFPPLDDSAVTTVRDRWRFVPARRGTTPIESRVTVPIRFRLDGGTDADARS